MGSTLPGPAKYKPKLTLIKSRAPMIKFRQISQPNFVEDKRPNIYTYADTTPN